MFLQVPVTFAARVRPEAGAEFEDRLLGDWVEVHVAEIAGADAPVAMRWDAGPRGTREAPDRTHETRWFEGSHWEPVLHKSERPAIHVDADLLAARCAEGSCAGNPLVQARTWTASNFVQGRVAGFAAVDRGSVGRNERDRAVQAAERTASGMVLVDGLLWKRRDEPVYVLSGMAGMGAYDRARVGGAWVDRGKPNLWRADRHGAMAALMERRLEGSPHEFRSDAVIEVLVAESVRFDPRVRSLVESLRGLETLNVSHAEEGTEPRRANLEAFAAAVKAASKEPNWQTAKALARAARAHMATGYAETSEYGARRIAVALENWSEAVPRREPTYASAPAP